MALVPGIVVLCVENRMHIGNRDEPRGDTLRLVHWNVFRGRLGWDGIERSLQQSRPDLCVLSEIPRGVSVEATATSFGHGYSAIRLSNLAVVARGSLGEGVPIPCQKGVRAYGVIWQSPRGNCRVMVVDLDSSLLLAREPRLLAVRKAMIDWRADIVVGDFNAPRRSRALSALPQGFVHAYDAVGSGCSYTWPMPCPMYAIDQCILGRRVRPAAYRLESSLHSDHRRQVLDFTFRDAETQVASRRRNSVDAKKDNTLPHTSDLGLYWYSHTLAEGDEIPFFSEEDNTFRHIGDHWLHWYSHPLAEGERIPFFYSLDGTNWQATPCIWNGTHFVWGTNSAPRTVNVGLSDSKQGGSTGDPSPPIEVESAETSRHRAGPPFHYPPCTTSQYSTATGHAHIYLVQEPETKPIAPDAPILIYMHGMGGREEQGMEIFPSLRAHLNELGWIYVCPRDNEYSGLLSDLRGRYGRRKVYLSGASAGGRWALWEAERHSERYAGLILMCPAVRRSSLILDLGDDPLPMPAWIVCGENDVVYATASRWLSSTLEKLGRDVHYNQIPGGDHNDPCKLIKWTDALAFVHTNSPTSSSSIETAPDRSIP